MSPALRAVLRDAQAKGGDIASPARLARWARARRSDNALGAHAFGAINRVFSNDALLPTLLRAAGLAGRMPPLLRARRHAAETVGGCRLTRVSRAVDRPYCWRTR